MEVIRLIHHKHYDPDSKRFRSLAFRNSSNDGGISVVDIECIVRQIQNEETVCDHVLKFYPNIAGQPIIYWIIRTRNIEKENPDINLKLEEKESHTGDICHINIKGLSNNKAKNFFYGNCCPPNLRICNKGIPHEIQGFDQIEAALNS